MHEVLNYIQVKKQEFSQLPLFAFMSDKSIDPRQRLSFAPCMAHFVMSFGDLNKYVFRSQTVDSYLQKIINQYTYEDEEHWPWFLQDIKNIGLDNTLSFTDALKMIWSEETKITRQISYQVAGFALNGDSSVKLTVIESLEAMAECFFSVSLDIVSELENIIGQELLYFGNLHLDVENEHTMKVPACKQYLHDFQLTESQSQDIFKVIDAIFNIFTEWTDELLAYAHNHPVEIAASGESQSLLACV